MALSPNITQQVRSLNALMAAAVGSERDKILAVDRAITYSSRTRSRNRVSAAPIATIAQRLFDLHNESRPGRSMRHLEIHVGEHQPLWLTAAVRKCLAELRGNPDGLLLITGLRAAICSPGKRFSPKRQQEFEATTQQIYRLVAKVSRPRQRIHVIVL